MTRHWSMRITGEHWAALQTHLFPGDHREHAAVLRCGLADTPSGMRLLVRDVVLARDGVDFIQRADGTHSLVASFVLDNVLRCAVDHSIYVAVHCHGGTDEVGFSGTDFASHENGYPAILHRTKAAAVGALVFAENAVAGDLWLADGRRVPLQQLTVTGPNLRLLTPAPTPVPHVASAYNRQSRLFGDRGQALLASQKAAIVGLGGAGSLLSQTLSRLGVGEILLIDDDRVETSNLSRLVGATRWDAHSWSTDGKRPQWLQRLGQRFSTHKVTVARRVARSAPGKPTVRTVARSVIDPDVAMLLRDCDHIFLAADTAPAELLVNAVGHQYLIPVTQVGAKVVVDRTTGNVLQAYAVSRLNGPGSGCLRCTGMISSDRLRRDSTDPEQLRRQDYIGGESISAPSVITLNSVATALAANDWLMRTVGLNRSNETTWWTHAPALKGTPMRDLVTTLADCPWCGADRLGLGDAGTLPTRMR